MKKLYSVLVLLLVAVMGLGAQQKALHSEQKLGQPFAHTAAAKSRANLTPIHSRAEGSVGGLYDFNPARYTATPPMRVLGDGTTIYGSIIYASSWVGTGARYGIYSAQAAADPQVKQVVAFESYQANGGGTLVGDEYCYNSYVYTAEMGYTFSTYLRYNLKTGQLTKNTQSFINGNFDQQQITHDLTYDPTSGTVYAISYIKVTDADGIFTRFRPAISTLDTYTGFVTPIAETQPVLIAIACTPAGELYGVSKGASSTLYRVNKSSGECTAIGRTGLNPEYVQSMTFDPVTNKLYWAETELSGSSGLYEVDIKSGKASKICSFADNEEFTGLYIPAPVVDDDAPAAVKLATDFAGGALSGNLVFTAPTLSHCGRKLTGTLTMEVDLDGVPFMTRDVAAGEAQSLAATLTEGIHSYSVYFSNSYGEGPRTAMSWYVGVDAPGVVGDLKVEANAEGEPVISWTAPTAGRNGGYVDPAQLTYTVVRMPEGFTVAKGIISTSFTDRSNFEASNVWYEVTAHCGDREGVTASTATALFGKGSELPVTYDFNTKEQFELCTVVDANGDADKQYKWGYWMYSPDFTHSGDVSPCLIYGFHPENAADDWVFVPPFTAQAGKAYRLTFSMWTKGNREKLSVTAGSTPTPSGQTVILAEKDYTHKTPEKFTVEFRAVADGNCYIGFHCTSVKKMFYLYVDDVTIDEVPDTSSPAAVSEFTVTPGAKGEMSATLSLKAPATTAGGDALAKISRIDVFRGNNRTAIHSFANPTPGAVLSWTDSNPEQGFNTYRAVASNTSGDGEKALASAFVGHDLAVAATRVYLTDEDGYPTLRWTAPTTGQNGGYVDSENLTYRITRSDGIVVSRTAKGTSFVDKSLNGAEKQHFIYYQIEPITPAGIGAYALSNHIVYGDPYHGNFFESFSEAMLGTDPWMLFKVKGDRQLWTIASQGYSPTAAPADKDGGLAVFATTSGRQGDECRLVSPKLAINDMSVPVFAFAFYHCPDEGTLNGEEQYQDRLIPELLLPDGTFEALGKPLYVDDPKYAEGWYLYTYDLTPYKIHDYVQLSFHGIAQFANDVYVDYVMLENNDEYDLTVSSFTGPSVVKLGKSAKYRATVFNQGMKVAKDYSVRLLCDGVECQSIAGDSIRRADSQTFDFIVNTTPEQEGKSYRYSAEVVFANDRVPSNNISNEIVTKVAAPDVPQVRKVATASSDGEVKVSWTEADAFHMAEGFEDYTPFAIEDIGDYAMVDGDKGYTYTFRDINYPNAGQPMAFMTFNPAMLGITMLEEWRPRNGKQVLAAFSASDAQGKPIDSDDWFISPELIPGTKLSFWAKTGNWEFGEESFEVLYSTTDRSVVSFAPVTGILKSNKDWTEYSYTLPLDARYFAIHYKSNDGFVFYLDDMAYTRTCNLVGEVLSGFRIYRDGVAIGETTADKRDFNDKSPLGGTHNYGVTAIFGKREGKAVTSEITVGESGVEAVAEGMSVSTTGDAILVSGTADAVLTVVDALGRTVYRAQAPTHRIPAPAGVYIITAGEECVKVIK